MILTASTLLSRKIELIFFKMSSIAVFTLSFKSYEILLYSDPVSLPFHGRTDETIF